jgi:hypothetical protein
MPAAIHLKPKDVWAFFERNKERLCREMVLIAENTDTDTKLYLSSENNLPYIYAVVNGKEVSKEGMITALDASDTTYGYYFKYLVTPDKKAPLPDDSDCPPEDDEKTPKDVLDEIYEREDALYFALRDFLEVALDVDEEELSEYQPDVMDQMLDDVLSLLAERYACAIYRPTLMDDTETGLEYIENYPYSM